MSKYFPPCNNSSENIKVELDLSNYVTKDDKTDIFKLENRIKENEKEANFSREFFHYRDQSDFVYECRANSFNYAIYTYQHGSQQAFLIIQPLII